MKLTLDIFQCGPTAKAYAFLCMCFERPKKESIKPTQRRSSVIQKTYHSTLHDFGLCGSPLITNVNSATCLLLCIAQSKHRHLLFIVHCPIKTPPRVFYCAFCCTGKKKLKSNMFYNLVPLRARVKISVTENTVKFQ